MFKGLFFAIAACFIWGLIFVVPQYLADFSAIEVVLGRYLSYGVISALLFFRAGFGSLRRYSFKEWRTALMFALVANIIYYLGLVAGLRLASPTLTVLVIGMAPIFIAFYGNWQAKEISYRALMMPCMWMSVGLLLVNATEVDWSFQGEALWEYLLGLAGMTLSMIAWTWYAVHNAKFLKENTHIPAGEWSTVMGVATLFWASLMAALFILFGEDAVHVSRFLTLSPDLLRYLVCAAILGALCSWTGCFLWSRASVYLPISLMGPLLIFETLFGLIYVYVFQKELPSWLELTGVVIMLLGIFMSVNAFRKKHASI